MGENEGKLRTVEAEVWVDAVSDHCVSEMPKAALPSMKQHCFYSWKDLGTQFCLVCWLSTLHIYMSNPSGAFVCP